MSTKEENWSFNESVASNRSTKVTVGVRINLVIFKKKKKKEKKKKKKEKEAEGLNSREGAGERGVRERRDKDAIEHANRTNQKKGQT